MGLGPLDYQRPGKAPRRVSVLAVVVFALGCLFALPIVTRFLVFRLESYWSPAMVFFAPPCAVMVLALLAILGIRWDERKRGLGLAVAGFWLGFAGCVTAGILMGLMTVSFGG